LTTQLIEWYTINKRDLPWRKTLDPYKIWVSEIILQQTQIKTGIKYYQNFIKKFPNIQSLSEAKDIDVLKIWQGLGYYRRALNMLETAKKINTTYNKGFPSHYNELIQLKGIGEYTAAAISSICFNEKRAVLDGNVYRVLSRVYNISDPINANNSKKKFQKIANKLISHSQPGIYNQAIMDFGSIHCKQHNPKCNTCPIQKKCQSFELNLVNRRPIKTIKKKYKIRYFNYFVVEKDNYIMIQQRNNNDIWRQLYELPLLESPHPLDREALVSNKFFKQFQSRNVSYHYKTQHLLSHQKLIISFWKINTTKIEFDNLFKKIKLSEIREYPFPKPLKKYFDKEHLNLVKQ